MNLIFYFATYKVLLDYLKVFFSTISARKGFKYNTTATQFEAPYKRLIKHPEAMVASAGDKCIIYKIRLA